MKNTRSTTRLIVNNGRVVSTRPDVSRDIEILKILDRCMRLMAAALTPRSVGLGERLVVNRSRHGAHGGAPRFDGRAQLLRAVLRLVFPTILSAVRQPAPGWITNPWSSVGGRSINLGGKHGQD